MDIQAAIARIQRALQLLERGALRPEDVKTFLVGGATGGDLIDPGVLVEAAKRMPPGTMTPLNQALNFGGELRAPTRIANLPSAATPSPLDALNDMIDYGEGVGRRDVIPPRTGAASTLPETVASRPAARSVANAATAEMATAAPATASSAFRRFLGRAAPYAGKVARVAGPVGGAIAVADMLRDLMTPSELGDGTLPRPVDAPTFDASNPMSQTPVVQLPAMDISVQEPMAAKRRDFNVTAGVTPDRSAKAFSPSLRDMIQGIGASQQVVEPMMTEVSPREMLGGGGVSELAPTSGAGEYERTPFSMAGGDIRTEEGLDQLLAMLKLKQEEQAPSALRRAMTARQGFRDFYSGGGLQ